MATAAKSMKRRCHDLLARSRFALDQHIDIRIRNVTQGFLDALHGGRSADEGHFISLHRKRRVPQAAVLQHQTALFGRVQDGGGEPVGRIGLGQEVIGALAHALDRGRDIAVAGDKDDRQFWVDGTQSIEQLQAIDVRHADIGYDHAVEVAVQGRQCRPRGSVCVDGHAVQLQGLDVCPTQVFVVIDEDDMGRCGHALVKRWTHIRKGVRGLDHGEKEWPETPWLASALRNVRMNRAPPWAP
ncbi:hypothetical protein D3C72_1392900 [compost metagenome]